MQLEISYFTDKGLRRESNQDSLLVNRNLGLFIVADGMGGHSGGEVASSMAVETVEEIMKTPSFQKMDPREAIRLAYEEASGRIYSRASASNSQLTGMGTTMVIVLVRAENIYIGNVGDSRCYLFKKPYLWQITEDHSLLNEQIRSGFLSEDQVANFVGKNVITRSVGYEREVQPDILERQIQPGETYLMCSDGLSGLVPDSKISEILNTNPINKAVKLCLEQALKNGGDDNVTILALHFKP